MKYIKKNKFALIGAVLGLLVGYLYYHFVGCDSGSCSITSKPINSTMYGGVLGALLLSLVDGYLEKRKKSSDEV